MTANQSQPVHLPAHVGAAIVTHAREGKPEEICGVVRGRGLHAHEVIHGRNIAAEPIENYEVDPQTLLLQFKFEDDGDEMMGIYHSHPVSEAYPSATDAWNAHYPDSIYLICSLENDDAPVILAFRMTPHFLELDLDELRRSQDFYETRPGLFAYFQSDSTHVPDRFQKIASRVSLPFYVVYFVARESQQNPDYRVVSLQELPVRSG